MISIIVPVYNEEKGLKAFMDGLTHAMTQSGLTYEIIAVNDGSTDKTADILKGYDDINVLEHQDNRGYGAALMTGFRAAEYDTIAITDADGTYPNGVFPTLVGHLKDCDMVVGARSNSNIPFTRRPAKWFLAKLANYLTGEKIPDLNSGLRVMRKEVLVKFMNILPTGFSFTTTITLAMLTNNYRVKFIPIDYHKRVGRSKVRPIRDTLNFVQVIVRTVMYFAPLKVFVPLSLLVLAGLIFSSIYDLVRGNITDKTVLLFIAFLMILAIGGLADLIDKRLQ